jgi:hypothetical protein
MYGALLTAIVTGDFRHKRGSRPGKTAKDVSGGSQG